MDDSAPSPAASRMQRLLLSSRYLVWIAVVVSLLVGAGTFIVATADAVGLVRPIASYVLADSQAEHVVVRNQIVTHIVEVVDGYLLAAALLIFALGLHTLFISPLPALSSVLAPSAVFLVRTFDDLKDRLAKVVLLILIVELFKHALEMNIQRPLDLLYLALAILLVSLAIAFSHGKLARATPGDGLSKPPTHGDES